MERDNKARRDATGNARRAGTFRFRGAGKAFAGFAQNGHCAEGRGCGKMRPESGEETAVAP